MNWVNKDTEIYCSFAKKAGNTGCQMMNSAFYYHGLNKIYKSFSVDNIKDAISAVKILNIKGFAITMPYKKEVLEFVDEMDYNVEAIGAANTVINENGKLTAYNTDYLAALKYLSYYKYTARGWDSFYILGNGGYALAVQAAAKELDMEFTSITRDNWDWDTVTNLKNSLIYNCTPLEQLSNLSENNVFIDCIATTTTGHKLATMQAGHQFKLYTGLKFPY
jgi:shikimate 5-dehydrogenase